MAKRKPAPEPVARLTWAQAAAWRTRRHRLEERAPRTALVDVVSEIACVHAQVMSSAELTLWARVEGLSRDDVQKALWDRRALVKTWAMRGTLHLLPAVEFAMWQAALSTYDHYLKDVWFRAFEITREQLEQLIDAVGDALGGRELTREELAEEVARRLGSEEQGERIRSGWGTFLKPASFRGKLCFAPSEGKNVRFTRPETWLGGLDARDPGEAMLDVARRFVGAHGPTTREYLARWWAGVTPAAAGRLIADLEPELAPVEVEGEPMWMLAGDVSEASEATPAGVVRLLPAFDHYVVTASGHADRLLPGPLRDRVYRKGAWLTPVLLVDGRMDGVWRWERKGKRLLVTIEPFRKLPAWARRAAEAEAERLAGFLGGALELGFGPLPKGG